MLIYQGSRHPSLSVWAVISQSFVRASGEGHPCACRGSAGCSLCVENLLFDFLFVLDKQGQMQGLYFIFSQCESWELSSELLRGGDWVLRGLWGRSLSVSTAVQKRDTLCPW